MKITKIFYCCDKCGKEIPDGDEFGVMRLDNAHANASGDPESNEEPHEAHLCNLCANKALSYLFKPETEEPPKEEPKKRRGRPKKEPINHDDDVEIFSCQIMSAAILPETREYVVKNRVLGAEILAKLVGLKIEDIDSILEEEE